jgi:hypothetical protein
MDVLKTCGSGDMETAAAGTFEVEAATATRRSRIARNILGILSLPPAFVGGCHSLTIVVGFAEPVVTVTAAVLGTMTSSVMAYDSTASLLASSLLVAVLDSGGDVTFSLLLLSRLGDEMAVLSLSSKHPNSVAPFANRLLTHVWLLRQWFSAPGQHLLVDESMHTPPQSSSPGRHDTLLEAVVLIVWLCDGGVMLGCTSATTALLPVFSLGVVADLAALSEDGFGTSMSGGVLRSASRGQRVEGTERARPIFRALCGTAVGVMGTVGDGSSGMLNAIVGVRYGRSEDSGNMSTEDLEVGAGLVEVVEHEEISSRGAKSIMVLAMGTVFLSVGEEYWSHGVAQRASGFRACWML